MKSLQNQKPRLPSKPLQLSALGAALKEERMNLGMTQVQVSEKFGVSLKALRNLEQGIASVSFATVVEIFKIFGKELRVGDFVVSPQKWPATRPRRKKILETLELVRPVLEKKFKVRKIALFGSCARDKATKKSDVDLAVEFFEPATFTLLGQVTVFLETLLEGHRVDLVEFEKMIPEVRESAQRDYIYV